MRKFLTVTACAVAFAVLVPSQAFAQKYRGQTVIGANGAFSLVGAVVFGAFNITDRAIEGFSARATPGISTSIDVGLTPRFSVGGAYFVQSAYAEWTSYTDTAGNTYTGEYYFRLKRENFGLRALFHFGAEDDFDPYFGVRLGISRWTSELKVETGSNIDLFDERVFRNRFLPQAIFGVRYFFLPFLGVNTEIAIGFPYYLSLGVNFRFGGMKQTP